jgi:hypothetical protein
MVKLPTFEMVINPDETSDVEVSFVALVDKPAIEKNFLAFKDAELHFAVDQEQRIISGPAMIADSLIYRRDDQGEYNVFFSADTIRQIALKFFKKDYQKNLNLFHDPALSLDGVTIFESFVSDKSRGIQPMKAFKDLPDGTWFISAKIENEAVWEKVKSGEVKGFSVEGIFSFIKRQNGTELKHSHLISNDSLMADIREDFKTMFADLKKLVFGPADVIPPAPAALATDYTLKDGTAVSIDKLEVGGVVLIAGAPAADGEYELADGTKLKVSAGAIAEVAPPVAADQNPDYSSQFATYDQKFADYEQKFKTYEDRFAAQDKLLSNANATIVQLVSIVEKLAEAPASDPVGDTKTNFTTQKIESKEEKRKILAAAFQKIKTKN